VAEFCEFAEQFALDQMDLPIVRELWLPLRQVSVLHEPSGLGISLDAVTLNQPHACGDWLAEPVTGIAAYADHSPFFLGPHSD